MVLEMVIIAAEEEGGYNPTNAVLFFGMSLVLGIVSRHLLKGTRLPYTVALLLLGIALGSLEYGTRHRLGKIGDGIRIWANIDPDLLLTVFLPALLFESSLSMEVHQVKKCMAQMVILAGPGVLISTFIVGTALKVTFPYNWSWKTSLLLGGLLSATDPVAVVALLKELGSSKKLSTLVEGESLMNDGMAIVVYTLFFRMITGSSFSWRTVINYLATVSLGASGYCIWFGVLSMAWVYFQRYNDRSYNDSLCELPCLLHGDSEIALAIINESEREGKEAKKFLEEVRITFPQVLRVLKTRQVTYVVLSRLNEYVQDLEKSGLLVEKELVHLHDSVQTDLKKLLRNPTLVKIPKLHNLVSVNPLLGALPSAVREQIVGSTKETTKQRGTALYREGSKPNGIWVISDGVVKWASNRIRNKHSLHPTFSHGSTLGLYEVLIGKPYMCDIVTNSVVRGFFIEAEKMHSVLGSDHAAVEDFLWQESSIILSKLLLPEIFEKMAMHELRTLVAERSTMSTLITGECFDLPQNMVGLLLEGFIKTQGTLELITAPAALLPSYSDRSFRVSEIAVETRARVIMFDIAGFVASRADNRRTSSLVSHGGHNPPRSTTRECSSLMSWPERRTKSRQHLEHPSEIDQHGNNFSARAMQLSLYGSMISDERHSPRISSNVLGKPPKKPWSYTRVSPTENRRLISVKPEGPYTVRKNVNVGEIASESLIAPRENSSTIDTFDMDYSSDEFGA